MAKPTWVLAALASSMVLIACGPVFAQTPAASGLPHLIRFSGTAKDATGQPVTRISGFTLSLYAEQTGGTAVWSEQQNVTPDRVGRYTVLLGASRSEGLPTEL